MSFKVIQNYARPFIDTILLLVTNSHVHKRWPRRRSCITAQALGWLIEATLFVPYSLILDFLKIFFNRYRTPFKIDLYLSNLYIFKCLHLKLLILFSHLLLIFVYRFYLQFCLLTGIPDYFLLISDVLPKCSTMRLFEHSSYQFVVVALYYFVPVNFYSNLAKKLINWFILYAFLHGWGWSFHQNFLSWTFVFAMLSLSFVNCHLFRTIILLMNLLWKLCIHNLRLF